MAEQGVVAGLLPGAFYYLRETRLPPIERMRELGVQMAVSTDCNPGTSPIASLLLAMNMACVLFRMTAAEVLRGVIPDDGRPLGRHRRRRARRQRRLRPRATPTPSLADPDRHGVHLVLRAGRSADERRRHLRARLARRRLHRPPPRQGQASGSGFVVGTDGTIVTNDHVVEGADAASPCASRENGEPIHAKVVGTDPSTDLALLEGRREQGRGRRQAARSSATPRTCGPASRRSPSAARSASRAP